jgi:hypothetical protein
MKMISYQDMLDLSDYCNQLKIVSRCFKSLFVDQEIEDEGKRELALHLFDHLLKEQEEVLREMSHHIAELRDQDFRQVYPHLPIPPGGMDPSFETTAD